MKALILAAGFGTRLQGDLAEYERTPYYNKLRSWVDGNSKGLVPIGGIPIADHQLSQIQRVGIPMDKIYVHTNDLHHKNYLKWASQHGIPEENIFNNAIVDPEKKNEQVKDMLQALTELGYTTPVLLFACDTLVHNKEGDLHNLGSMVAGYHDDGLSRVIVYHKTEKAYNHGVVDFDNDGTVIHFREKPKGIDSGWVNASIYLLSPEKIQEMVERSEELQTYKNPLQLVWEGFKVEKVARRLDIGRIEDVIKANNLEDVL
ncbi:NTP transferase domain-containing protein [Candidatus Woesearchaeota archaeon]|nr:NTP transferase domain-containing protein [Candidatus Woesearchaeota archaeon]